MTKRARGQIGPGHQRMTITQTPWQIGETNADRGERSHARSIIATRRRKEEWSRRIKDDPKLQEKVDAFDAKHGIDKDWVKDPKRRALHHFSGSSHKKVTLPKLKLPE